MFTMARKDLDALSGMNDAATFADEVFGFHAQQAVEKTLKAWSCILGVEYPKTHDIRLLLRILRERGCQVEGLRDLVEYNAFAVEFRYEPFDTPDEPLDRPAVLSNVKNLVEHVERLVRDAEAAG